MKVITETDVRRAVLKSVARTYYAEIVAQTPGRGNVADGWEIDIIDGDVVIFNNEFGDVINFLEYGTKPHIIRAKNTKYLRFKLRPGDGVRKPKHKIPGNRAFVKDGFVFAKAVYHPGSEARLFIDSILNSSEMAKQFEESLEIELKALL